MKLKTLLSYIFFAVTVVICTAFVKEDIPIYKDPLQSVEKRVDDLLSRMTVEEKIGQLCQYVGLTHMRESRVELSEADMKKSHAMGFYADCPPEQVEKMVEEGITGSFLHVLNVKEANYLQSLALKSRLQIPLLIGIDAMHGTGLVSGATVYPTEIGQASSFNPWLVETIGRQTALEMRATGSQWTFGPNIEVARDARWGRTGDTFGEDPFLVSVLGVSAVKGLQGKDFSQAGNVIACAKHFVGGSQPVNGINGAPADFSERTLYEVFLPPFKACVDAGIFTVMAAHNEYNGVPCHGNHYLLTEILRDKWGFKGFVVSDWMDIERMQDYHCVGETMEDVYKLTLDAGMDMHMHGPDFYKVALDMYKKGEISQERIEKSARKILEAKFRLGLFENPMVDETATAKVLFNAEHQQTALQAARESIVLLKNEGLLPLDSVKYKRVLVTGPNADNQSILGDWAMRQPDENITTIYNGLRKISPQTNFTLLPMDWNLHNLTSKQVEQAAKQAKNHDLTIVVVGENSMRYHWNEKTCGENSDRYDISLFGEQEALVEALYKTGKPVVVVLVNGRPLATEWIADNIPAIVEAWEPGAFGGQAVAEILYGKVNPSAKLPVTIPRHSGQIQTYYNHRFTSQWFNYATGNSAPLYEFGYGLSYTTFSYSEPRLSADEIRTDGTLKITVDVTNTGKMEGTEIVQLYIRDCFSSATRPVKELRDFKRVTLRPGETQKVEMLITPDKLAFYNAKMEYVVEPGKFIAMVGGSSGDSDLKKIMFNVKW
jgi:beta-glucosidase